MKNKAVIDTVVDYPSNDNCILSSKKFHPFLPLGSYKYLTGNDEA